jgi:copper(I)-binding protein
MRLSKVVAILVLSLIGTAATAQETRVGELQISRSWMRATPPGSTVGAWYLEIVNNGEKSDRLVGGSVAVSTSIEIHETKINGGIARMRPIAEGIVLAPQSTTKLEPGGAHIMLVGLKQPLKQGQRVKGTLIFSNAGAVELDVPVESLGSAGPTHQHGSGH